jgi:hypothetical protein
MQTVLNINNPAESADDAPCPLLPRTRFKRLQPGNINGLLKQKDVSKLPKTPY